MKNENVKSVKVYSDLLDEAAAQADLEKAKVSLQKVVETWNDLDIGPVTDLYTLINDPEASYTEAINKNVEVPGQPGKYQISKDIWIKSLSFPVPNLLYLVCKEARKVSYMLNPDLWQLHGNKIDLVESEAAKRIYSQNVYASTPEAIEAVETAIQACESLNKLNKLVKGELLPPVPYTTQFCRGFFLLKQKFSNSPFELSVDPVFKRRLARG